MPDSMSDEEHLEDESDEEEEAVSIWHPLSPVSSRPAARPAERCGHVAVSSGNGKRLLIMGGYNGKGILSLRAVWEFDFETRAWSTLDLVDGPAPPDRAYFRGCTGPPTGTDEREEREPFVYIHGGLDAEGDPLGDIWCLDVENRTWIEVQSGRNGVDGDSAIPSSRFNHAMCRMGASLAVHGGELTSGSLLGDLCVFHPGTASWSDVRIPSGGPRPCPRSSHCLGYAERSVERSSTLGSLVLFGGLGQNSDGSDEEGAQPLNDLWVLSSVTEEWLRGLRGTGEDDCSTPVWSLVVLEGIGPSPRSLSALSPRPGDTDLFLFGGYGLVELSGNSDDLSASEGDGESEGGDIVVAYIDDLWMLNLNEGVASKPQWVDEEGMGFAGESIVEGRNGHTLTWCGHKLVLFGGFVGDGFDASLHVAEPPSSTRAVCA